MTVNPPGPRPPKHGVGFTDTEWKAKRAAERYIDSSVAGTRVCLDCGSVVHLALLNHHDDFHDGSE